MVIKRAKVSIFITVTNQHFRSRLRSDNNFGIFSEGKYLYDSRIIFLKIKRGNITPFLSKIKQLEAPILLGRLKSTFLFQPSHMAVLTSSIRSLRNLPITSC